MQLFDAFHYQFMQRAMLAGCCIAVLCSTLGVFLVLRRLSLIGDGLAHVTFGSVAVGLLLRTEPMYAAIPLVMLSSLGILRLVEKARVYGDAAIGIVSSLGIAGGITLVSLSGGFNVDLFSFLFGSILSVSGAEVITSVVLSAVVILMVILFYDELVSITFDEECARASGIRTRRINAILVLLTALTVVLAMKVVGIMLVSAMLILPASAALQVGRSFRMSMVIAAAISVFSVVFGIWISFMADLPAGGTIVLTNFVIFVLILGYRARTPSRARLLEPSPDAEPKLSNGGVLP
jgi:zinc transport system permease protein